MGSCRGGLLLPDAADVVPVAGALFTWCCQLVLVSRRPVKSTLVMNSIGCQIPSVALFLSSVEF